MSARARPESRLARPGGSPSSPLLDQLERALERGDARRGAVEVALRAGGRLEDPRGAPRVRLRAEARERRLEQGEPASRIAERARGVRRAGEHADAVGAGPRLGVGHPVPQLERALEQRPRLAVGVHALGGGRGAHRGRSAAGWSPAAAK